MRDSQTSGLAPHITTEHIDHTLHKIDYIGITCSTYLYSNIMGMLSIFGMVGDGLLTTQSGVE